MSGQSRYPNVFRPVMIGNTTVRNRIFMSALTTNFGVDSRMTDQHVAFLAERARGGIGLIITEALEVHPSGLAGPGRIHVSDAESINGLRAVANAVHREGAMTFAQLTHSGYTLEWAPSVATVRPWDPVPHAMSGDEIDLLISCFRSAAERIREAGLDGIQVHLGHGHLLHRFLSDKLNVRDDEYGGSRENRLRLPMQVLRAIRDAVGADFPVGVRISSDEMTELGPWLPEMQAILSALLSAIELDFVDVSQSGAGLPGLQLPDMSYGPTPFLPQARSYAPILGDVPLMTACRFTELHQADAALATGEVAMVGMARAHVADPAIVRKALDGRESETRPCVACNFCAAGTAPGGELRCMVNVAAGREWLFAEEPEQKTEPKRVLVVGGGPAGLEFARVASSRGHSVSLWEQSDRLGGELRIGEPGFGRSDLGKLADYLGREAKRAGVDVQLSKPATVAALADSDDDIYVIATGASAMKANLPGWGEVENSDLILSEGVELEGLTVIIDYESGWRSATAIETAAQQTDVLVVTPHDSVFSNVNSFVRAPLLHRLSSDPVEFCTMHVPLIYSADSTLTIRSIVSGNERHVKGVSHLWQTLPKTPSDALAHALRSLGRTVVTVGDARLVGDILTAIADGHAEARALDRQVVRRSAVGATK